MKKYFLIVLFFVGCKSNSAIIENCRAAYDKTEDAIEELQQIKNFVIRCAQNGQTDISSEQMIKQVMPKASIAADLLAEAGQYLSECVEQDEKLFKLRKEIQSLTNYEDRIRNIYTLCDNNYLISMGSYDNEIQLIIASLDNTANDIINTALSINTFMTHIDE